MDYRTQVVQVMEKIDDSFLYGLSTDDLLLVTEALMGVKSDISNDVYTARTVEQLNKILFIKDKNKKTDYTFLNNSSIFKGGLFSNN